MTNQDTAQAEDHGQGPASEDTDDRARDDKPSDGTLKEKPEPDEDAKEKAAEMMKSYEDRPTLVVPGSGGAISGTAVNDWLDDDGNPKFADDEDSPANKAKTTPATPPIRATPVTPVTRNPRRRFRGPHQEGQERDW